MRYTITMPIHPQAAAFFSKQMEDPENHSCCDSGAGEPTWASISHGIYLCINAAGVHRSLGVKTSFVQSTTMDSWTPKHLKMMELGGNRRFNEFMTVHCIAVDMPIREKYRTRAAKWYRENLLALAEGLGPLEPLLKGTGHLPVDIPCSSAQCHLDRVFVGSPKRGSMTIGGINHDQVVCIKHDQVGQASLTEAKPLNMCQHLVACFRQRYGPVNAHTSPEPENSDHSPLTGSYPDLGPDEMSPVKSLPVLLGSDACPDVERLQILSSGKMEGFGST